MCASWWTPSTRWTATRRDGASASTGSAINCSAPTARPRPASSCRASSIEFNRLPPGDEPTKIAYADESGITVYGSKQTRFLYEVTNTVRDGRASRGVWDTGELPPGDYTLRIFAADFSGNEAEANRDLPITIER